MRVVVRHDQNLQVYFVCPAWRAWFRRFNETFAKWWLPLEMAIYDESGFELIRDFALGDGLLLDLGGRT